MNKLFTIIIVSASVLCAVSCEKYEDGKPSKSVRNEFARMYPEAFDIEWSKEGMYWEVSFETGSRPDGTEHEAWYDEAGNWVRTTTEMMVSSVPSAILDYLDADPVYGTAPYADNEVDFIQTPSGDFYRFDLRVDGKTVEVDVNYDGEVSFARYDF